MLKTPYEGINKWSKLLHSEKHTNLIYRLAMSYCKTSHTKQGIHQNLEFKKNFKLKQPSRTQTFHVSKFYLLLIQIHPLDLHSYQLKHSCFERLTNAWQQNNRKGIEDHGSAFSSLSLEEDSMLRLKWQLVSDRKIKKKEETSQMSSREMGWDPAWLIFELVLKHAKVSVWYFIIKYIRRIFLSFSTSFHSLNYLWYYGKKE